MESPADKEAVATSLAVGFSERLRTPLQCEI